MIQRRWLASRDAAFEIGRSVSTLHRWRLKRKIQYRIHWRRSSLPNAKTPRYEYNIASIKQLLEE